jgi:hypothetical protein
VGAVHRLPLEEFLSPDELRALPVRQLKQLVEEARRVGRNAHSRRGGGARSSLPLEKEDLVAELLSLRNADASSGTTCGICLDNYASGALLRVLPCGHRFHVECVDSWLVSHSAACPFCAARVEPGAGAD